MDLAPLAGIATAAAAVFGRLLPGRAVGGRRREVILRDLDLFDRLPESSSARKVLLDHIERSVIQLTLDETTKRRNPSGMTLAAMFLIGGGLLVYVGWNARGWEWTWWISGVFCLALGAFGLVQDATRAERDEKGRRIKGEGA
ncbi:hypothetical protein PO878_21415 [Iamia majanohamensis]|uniref:Uncharacterized protein n=1 Tax=Iamia majanohamensis TaxID=467976 RepID=A0AAE9Y9J9_9ACTN|nr:hypothetical protein [Iamia majanohamensis]WCO67053.1 hypothetical protein PO878_21415 [Iamia majanohamensis]